MASITKRPDGRWRARYRDAAGKEHARHFDRKIDGTRWLDVVTASVVRGDYVDPDRARLTVGAWANTWMASRSHLKPSTLAAYRSLLRTQVLPTWADTPMAKVSHGDVAGWVARMRADLSASRTRQSYHLLTSMLDDAVRDNRLSRNAAAGVALPRLPRSVHRYLSHTQLDDLATACGPDRPLILTLGYCGLRWGELAALRTRRVDLLRARIRVVEAVTAVDGRLVFGEPKSHQHRTVPLPRFLCDELAPVLAGREPDDLAFPSPRGQVQRVGAFRRRGFDEAAAAVGAAGLVPHELRHTAASLAIAAGASVKAVQSMLGHASATLTLDRYGHLFGDELDAVAERLEVHRADALRTQRGLAPVASIPALTSAGS